MFSVVPTAVLHLSIDHKNWYCARAILDTGSEVNLISKCAALRMKLVISPSAGFIGGVGGGIGTQVIGKTRCLISQGSLLPDLIVPLLVVNATTNNLPTTELPHERWTHLHSLQLADPMYYKPSSVDIILGSSIFDCIDRNKIQYGVGGSPNARLTTLGWIVSGPRNNPSGRHVSFHPNTQQGEYSHKNRKVETSSLSSIPPISIPLPQRTSALLEVGSFSEGTCKMSGRSSRAYATSTFIFIL